MIVDGSNLSYEEACRIAGVPEERGYVTLQEVVNAISEKFGIELVASDQIGWDEAKEMDRLTALVQVQSHLKHSA